MMLVDNYQGKKFYKGESLNVDDHLTVEQALQIKINDESFTVTMRTPGNDTDLIRGLLYAEDICRGEGGLNVNYSVNKKQNITEANITIHQKELGNGYLNSRNILSVSSCGICGKKELEDIDVTKRLKNKDVLLIDDLYKMFDEMKKEQIAFYQSGGSHAAAAFSKNGQLLSIREDIGRHNAVDKVIGDLMNQGKLKRAYCMTVSGRVSYEIITKAFSAKIPILAAVSAPSTLAVDFSKELGITLLGFCRDSKATCYSHPYRIKNKLSN